MRSIIVFCIWMALLTANGAPTNPNQCGSITAWYDGSSIDLANNVWNDKSGNDYDGVITSATGIGIYDDFNVNNAELLLNEEPVVFGTPNTRITFSSIPTIPIGHTIFNLCKYRESGTKNRILDSAGVNTLYGFWFGNSGVATEGYVGGNSWITEYYPANNGFGSDWVVSSLRRRAANDVLYRANGEDKTVRGSAGTGTAGVLTINNGAHSGGERSDFACAAIIVANEAFSDAQVQCVEEYLKCKYNLGFNGGCTSNGPTCGDGGIAVVEGDPHFINWDGARHHFQGQPTIGGKEQYYYMYPCNGYDENDMPIYMMGRHVKWGNRAVSGLDYVTLRIFDGGNEYLLFLSSTIRAYTLRSGNNQNDYLYDSYAAGALTTIANDGNPQSMGPFTVTITDKPQSGKPGVKTVIAWASCALDIEMFGQNSYNNGLTRYQMNKMVILPPKCLKCYTCGLLGSFPPTRRRLSAAQVIQTCDGSDYEYPSGFRGERRIYDANGWSWEVGYVDAGCQTPANAIYEPTVDVTIDTEPCAQSITGAVKTACAQARANMGICCDQIPAGTCDAVQTSCEIDACIAAAGDETQISSNVETAFTEVIEAICSVDNIENIGPDDDINECVENPTICGNNAECSNTIGSYQCICDPGYVKDGSTCVDIDECSNNPCGINGACVNEPGSYSCTCNGGYVFDGDTCVDYDECINDACNGNGECINTDGSFECNCNEGYIFDEVTCVDIDECIHDPCGEYGGCQNTVGSYVCNCDNGYTFDGTTCVDYDECIDDPCDGNGECINTAGTYECKYCITCNPGNSCVTPFGSANVNIFQTELVEWMIRGVLLLIIIGLICYIRCYSIGGKTKYYQSVKPVDTDSEFVCDENQKLNV